MTSDDFAMWLNGFLELANPTSLNEVQIEIIKDHLALVIEKKTPDRFGQPREEAEEKSKTASEKVLENLKLNPLTKEEFQNLLRPEGDLSKQIRDTINRYHPRNFDQGSKKIC